jgi:plasmid stability protein
MPQIVVRNIPEEVMDEFRKLAKRNGNSVESEIRQMIAASVDRDARMRRFRAASRRLLAESAKQDRVFGDSTDLIRDDRDR